MSEFKAYLKHPRRKKLVIVRIEAETETRARATLANWFNGYRIFQLKETPYAPS